MVRVAAASLLSSLTMAADEPSTAAAQIDAKPIECWSKTDKPAVHVAEQFRLILTCRIVESQRVSVAPNLAHLEPGAIQLAPFEVLDGERHDDIRSGIWTYFQYAYVLRLIVEDAFGLDVPIPPLAIQYSIRMSDAGGETQQGRERTYLLPALPMRVATLVPNRTDDIRDLSQESFDDITARTRRAARAQAAALTLFGFAAIFALLALVALVRTYREKRTGKASGLSELTLLRGAMTQLHNAGKSTVAAGWSAESLEAMLAALRVIAAITAGAAIAQRLVPSSTQSRAGQLAIRTGLRRRTVMVSAAMTPGKIDAYLASSSGQIEGGAVLQILRELRDALELMAAAQYASEVAFDERALQTALGRSMDAARRLRVVLLLRALRRAFRGNSGRAAIGVAA
jgi:hypothetical protein